MLLDSLSGCRYAVIGDPIEHSVSPAMQNAAFSGCGLGTPYGKIRVALDDLPAFVAFARTGLDGFNITVPHKQNIIPFLDEITPAARRAASVNTVAVRDGRLCGDSTDGYGLASALREAFGFEVTGGRLCFIGCGGAVQAVADYFAANGAAALYFVNRTVTKVEELCTRLRQNHNTELHCCGIDDRDAIRRYLADVKVIVQGTSVGLKPSDAAPIDMTLLPSGICCYDTIYKKTDFLRQAQQFGLQTADGRTMLLHQGAAAFKIWTGREPDLNAMRTALDQALNH